MMNRQSSIVDDDDDDNDRSRRIEEKKTQIKLTNLKKFRNRSGSVFFLFPFATFKIPFISICLSVSFRLVVVSLSISFASCA